MGHENEQQDNNRGKQDRQDAPGEQEDSASSGLEKRQETARFKLMRVGLGVIPGHPVVAYFYPHEQVIVNLTLIATYGIAIAQPDEVAFDFNIVVPKALRATWHTNTQERDGVMDFLTTVLLDAIDLTPDLLPEGGSHLDFNAKFYQPVELEEVFIYQGVMIIPMPLAAADSLSESITKQYKAFTESWPAKLKAPTPPTPSIH